MMKKPFPFAAGAFALGLLLLSTACQPEKPAAKRKHPPLRVAHDLWPGYFPLIIAQKKGFFIEHGVEVELIFTEDQQLQIADFRAGKYDGLALALGSGVIAAEDNPDIRIVLAIDASSGGDAVVAQADIKEISDLEGKVASATLGQFGEVFIERMLLSAGLSLQNVTLINADASQVAKKLESNEIQAGHVWEPYVSRAVESGMQVLYTSAETPGLIVDVLMFKEQTLKERPEDVRAFIKAHFQAIDFWAAHPEEGARIAMKAYGISKEEASLKGIELLSLEKNRQYFDPENPSSLHKNAMLYTDFFIRTGSLGQMPNLETLIDASCLPKS